MKARSETFLRNLEEAVVEHRKLACPNVDCNDMIISRELTVNDKTSEIHYWCRNQCCSYHQKRSIPLANSDNLVAAKAKTLSSAYAKVEKRSFSLMAYLTMIPMALLSIIRDLIER